MVESHSWQGGIVVRQLFILIRGTHFTDSSISSEIWSPHLPFIFLISELVSTPTLDFFPLPPPSFRYAINAQASITAILLVQDLAFERVTLLTWE